MDGTSVTGGGSGANAPPGYEWDADRRGYVPLGQTYAKQKAGANTSINDGSGITNSGTTGSMSGLSSATGGGSGGGGGGGGQVYTPNPDGTGPLLTQTGYENERLQGESNAAASQQQQAQLEAQKLAAQAADASRSGQMQLAAQLQAQAEQRRMGYFSTFTTGAGSQPTITHDSVDNGQEAAARSAAFARAKETAGQTAIGSLNALRDVVESHGLMGSSVDAAGTGAAISGASGAVNDFGREQLQQDLTRSSQLSDLKYNGAITQRGQNMSLIPSFMGLLAASSGSGLY